MWLRSARPPPARIEGQRRPPSSLSAMVCPASWVATPTAAIESELETGSDRARVFVIGL
jgi:hypothetical protein